MKSDGLIGYFGYIIAAFSGIALAYFVTGVIYYSLPVCNSSLARQQYVASTKKPDNKNITQTVIAYNVFDIDTGTTIKKQPLIIKKAKVVSSINGYKLVGFVSGKEPMALFKKAQKPVVIVTKKSGIDNVWLLDTIKEDGVYLKNKKTKEIKKFEFPKMTKKLAIFGKTISVTYTKPSYISPGVEKITVTKNILNRIGNVNTLFREINIVPVFKNGKAFGYRINYIAPNSVIRKIGLKRGDIIVSINGEPTTSPEKIMGLYSQIKNMTSVNMDIIRNGVKKTIFVDIK